MQRSRSAVRYYIDRNEEGTEVRSVPVVLSASEEHAAPRPAPMTPQADASSPTTPRAKRRRVRSLVRSAVRRAPHHTR